eukprot:SAG22_NODE_2334_length_2704_cov_1.163532_5_plen_134_part_00
MRFNCPDKGPPPPELANGPETARLTLAMGAPGAKQPAAYNDAMAAGNGNQVLLLAKCLGAAPPPAPGPAPPPGTWSRTRDLCCPFACHLKASLFASWTTRPARPAPATGHGQLRPEFQAAGALPRRPGLPAGA